MKTPNLDLLNTLVEDVALPAASEKLASAGVPADDMRTLTQAVVIGHDVADAVQGAATRRHHQDPMVAHAEKVASILGSQSPANANAAAVRSRSIEEKVAAAFA